MSLLIAVLKCLFCWEDDEDRGRPHSFSDRRYSLLGDCNHYTVSRINPPSTSQANFGSKANISRAHTESYPSQTKSTYITTGDTTDKRSVPVKLSRDDAVKFGARDSVSDTYASKQPSIPNREKIVNSLPPIKPSGNQIVTKPSVSSTSGKSNEVSQKGWSLSSPSPLGNIHHREGANKGTDSSSNNVPFVSSKQSQSSVSYSFSSDSFSSSPSTFETGKFHSSLKTNQPEKSHSPKPPPLSNRPTISPVSSSCLSPQKKATYTWVEKDASTDSSNDNVPSVSSKQTQSSVRFSFLSDSFNSSPSTFETGKFHSAQKTNQPEKSRSPKPPPLSIKPTISLVSSSSLSPQKTYNWVEKDASTTYVFPEEIKNLIEKGIVPGVLKMPLSKSSYKDYFHALLYAEDCYLEKWDGFEMENVKVQLHEAAIYTRIGKVRNLNKDNDKDDKVFVAFELDKIPERRPFLLSRDFVSLQPSNQKTKTFQGVIYRVVKSNLVLAEFEEEFYDQHHPEDKYDVKFSFNRVCLKRAHQAVAAASDSLLRNLLFPSAAPKHELPSTQFFGKNKYELESFAIQQIFRLQGLPPYLVEGPLNTERNRLSKTGTVIVEAILRILRADPLKKILLCAPVNNTCDILMRGLKKEMSESDMFRANAAFRELDGVPMDILPSCLYKEEVKCFSCPSLQELKKYKVILSTFMSSFRLYGQGIMAGHFSHVFLVDASRATEPETMVPLANFVTDKTIVVVTGEAGTHSGWVRSKIARQNGLRASYFERLCDSGMYKKLDPKHIAQLEAGKNEISSYLSSF